VIRERQLTTQQEALSITIVLVRAPRAVFKSRGLASIWKETAPRGEEAYITETGAANALSRLD
jgi:hypothetical protein